MKSNQDSIDLQRSLELLSGSPVRNIYGTAGPCVELEYAYRLSHHLELWSNIDWFWKKGHSLGIDNLTRIKIVNFSLGIKAPFRLHECHELYLGIGPSFAGVFIANNTCCGCEKPSKPAFGVVVKSGYYYDFCERFFLDMFADYFYESAHFQEKTVIGGIRVGAGIGTTF